MSDTTPFFFFCVAHTSPPRRSPRPQEAAATREHRAGAESGRREATPAGPGRLRPRAHHGPKKPLPFATTEPKKRMVIRTTYVPRFAASRPRPPTGGGGVVVTGGPPKKCISTAGARWLVRRPAEAGEAAPTKVTTREPSDRAAHRDGAGNQQGRGARHGVYTWTGRGEATCKAPASSDPGPARLEPRWL
ncbi:unnamed protein product, partial [Prorocentrum cordatum]